MGFSDLWKKHKSKILIGAGVAVGAGVLGNLGVFDTVWKSVLKPAGQFIGKVPGVKWAGTAIKNVGNAAWNSKFSPIKYLIKDTGIGSAIGDGASFLGDIGSSAFKGVTFLGDKAGEGALWGWNQTLGKLTGLHANYNQPKIVNSSESIKEQLEEQLKRPIEERISISAPLNQTDLKLPVTDRAQAPTLETRQDPIFANQKEADAYMKEVEDYYSTLSRQELKEKGFSSLDKALQTHTKLVNRNTDFEVKNPLVNRDRDRDNDNDNDNDENRFNGRQNLLRSFTSLSPLLTSFGLPNPFAKKPAGGEETATASAGGASTTSPLDGTQTNPAAIDPSKMTPEQIAMLNPQLADNANRELNAYFQSLGVDPVNLESGNFLAANAHSRANPFGFMQNQLSSFGDPFMDPSSIGLTMQGLNGGNGGAPLYPPMTQSMYNPTTNMGYGWS